MQLPLARITYSSQFRIPKFVVQISELRIWNCEVLWKRKVNHLGHRRNQ